MSARSTLLTLAIAASLASGCAPDVGCQTAQSAPPRLITPSNGETGVAVSTSAIVVGIPNDGTFFLRVPGGEEIGLVKSSTSSAATLTLRGFQLQSGTTYTVVYVPPASKAGNCEGETSGIDGTFTTATNSP